MTRRQIREEIFKLLFERELIDNDIQKRIKDTLDGWTYERLGTLEKVLLKFSFYEIIIKKVGYEIAINEAIEIAKKYSYNDTKEFLNGILAKLVRDQKALETV